MKSSICISYSCCISIQLHDCCSYSTPIGVQMCEVTAMRQCSSWCANRLCGKKSLHAMAHMQRTPLMQSHMQRPSLMQSHMQRTPLTKPHVANSAPTKIISETASRPISDYRLQVLLACMYCRTLPFHLLASCALWLKPCFFPLCPLGSCSIE